MKKALVFLLLGGVGAAAFLLWRRMQQQAAPAEDLWAPVETWPATISDRWPSTPAPVVQDEETPAPTSIADDSASDSAASGEGAPVAKRAPRKRAGS